MAITGTDFDAAKGPTAKKMIVAYLKPTFEERNVVLIRTASNDVARHGGEAVG